MLSWYSVCVLALRLRTFWHRLKPFQYWQSAEFGTTIPQNSSLQSASEKTDHLSLAFSNSQLRYPNFPFSTVLTAYQNSFHQLYLPIHPSLLPSISPNNYIHSISIINTTARNHRQNLKQLSPPNFTPSIPFSTQNLQTPYPTDQELVTQTPPLFSTTSPPTIPNLASQPEYRPSHFPETLYSPVEHHDVSHVLFRYIIPTLSLFLCKSMEHKSLATPYFF